MSGLWVESELIMSIAKVIEISASSTANFEDAIKQGVTQAGKTIDNICGAWVKEQKVVVENGAIVEFRVDLKLTFKLKG